MEQSDDFDRRQRALSDLLQVVEALRAVTAVRWQQAQALRHNADIYADTVGGIVTDLGVTELGVAMGPAPTPRCRVILAPEHGFVGPLADRLISMAADGPALPIFILGTRGMAAGRERGLVPHWSAPAASHSAALVDALDPLMNALLPMLPGADPRAVELIAITLHAGRVETLRRPLAMVPPVKPGTPPRRPLTQLPASSLHHGLMRQWLLATLAQAAANAFAAEQLVRLQTLSGSRERIGEKLAETVIQANMARQDRVGQEINDLLAGAVSL